ncbi:MAG: hypothetical protein AB1757_18545 [Acidobacteriota bacterium]
MDKTTKNRWVVWSAVFGIFALGFASGMLALNLYHKRLPSSFAGRGEPPILRLDVMTEKLDLTSEQRAEVEKIFSDTRAQMGELRKQSEPKFAEIRQQTESRLQQVLSAEQWEKFQQMKNEMHQRRGRRERGRRDFDGSR